MYAGSKLVDAMVHYIRWVLAGAFSNPSPGTPSLPELPEQGIIKVESTGKLNKLYTIKVTGNKARA
jgi:hypothetical protein